MNGNLIQVQDWAIMVLALYSLEKLIEWKPDYASGRKDNFIVVSLLAREIN